MGMKKIFCFFVILAILMSAMPTSIFAMTSNVTNASGMDETVPGTHEDSNVFSHVKAISLNSSTVSEAPKEEWNKTFGSTGDDEAWAVQQTDDGGYVLAGDTLFESGLCSAWLVKTNSQGEKEWEQTFRGTGFDSACSVQQTIDGGYIFAGDTLFETGLCTAWLLKTNSQGDMEWEQTFRGTGLDSASSVQQTSDGGYVLAGNTLFESGLCSAWLVKTNSQGDMEWEKTFGITGFDSVSSVQQTTDGGYILAGDTLSSDAGLTAAWLVKTNSKGEKEWDATFGGTGLDSAYSVNQTADGGYILAGETLSFYKGLCTAWLVKTNSKGIKEWEKTYGKTGLDSAYSVQQTTDGGYIFAGETFSLGAYGWTDAWLVKTDSEGNEIGERTFGGSGDDWASAAQQTADGGYVIAGSTDSYGDGDYDAWLIKVGGLSVKKVHNINTREDFATIQEAIDDEDTREGDVIIVDPGTYNENVNVYKSLTIKSTSESPVGTIVLAKDSNDHVFEATADHVTIHGFTVEGATGEQKNGIYLDSVNHCTIANNTVTNNYCGIELTSSSKNTLTNNNVNLNTGDGIYINASSDNNIEYNNVSENYYGVILYSSSSNTLTYNTVNSNTGDGIRMCSSSFNTLTNNNVNLNKGAGICVYSSCNDNKIYLNNFINNFDNVFSKDSRNRWNSNEKRAYVYYGNTYINHLGNYWSDYKEKYKEEYKTDPEDIKSGTNQDHVGDGDGIWDKPYKWIDERAGAMDNYPLVEPCGEQTLLPDLTIQNVTIEPKNFNVGDHVNISVEISNIGDISAEKFSVELWREMPLELTIVTELDSDSTTTITFPYTIRSVNESLSVIVNRFHDVAEKNYSNNRFNFSLTIPWTLWKTVTLAGCEYKLYVRGMEVDSTTHAVLVAKNRYSRLMILDDHGNLVKDTNVISKILFDLSVCYTSYMEPDDYYAFKIHHFYGSMDLLSWLDIISKSVEKLFPDGDHEEIMSDIILGAVSHDKPHVNKQTQMLSGIFSLGFAVAGAWKDAEALHKNVYHEMIYEEYCSIVNEYQWDDLDWYEYEWTYDFLDSCRWEFLKTSYYFLGVELTDVTLADTIHYDSIREVTKLNELYVLKAVLKNYEDVYGESTEFLLDATDKAIEKQRKLTKIALVLDDTDQETEDFKIIAEETIKAISGANPEQAIGKLFLHSTIKSLLKYAAIKDPSYVVLSKLFTNYQIGVSLGFAITNLDAMLEHAKISLLASSATVEAMDEAEFIYDYQNEMFNDEHSGSYSSILGAVKDALTGYAYYKGGMVKESAFFGIYDHITGGSKEFKDMGDNMYSWSETKEEPLYRYSGLVVKCINLDIDNKLRTVVPEPPELSINQKNREYLLRGQSKGQVKIRKLTANQYDLGKEKIVILRDSDFPTDYYSECYLEGGYWLDKGNDYTKSSESTIDTDLWLFASSISGKKNAVFKCPKAFVPTVSNPLIRYTYHYWIIWPVQGTETVEWDIGSGDHKIMPRIPALELSTLSQSQDAQLFSIDRLDLDGDTSPDSVNITWHLAEPNEGLMLISIIGYNYSKSFAWGLGQLSHGSALFSSPGDDYYTVTACVTNATIQPLDYQVVEGIVLHKYNGYIENRTCGISYGIKDKDENEYTDTISISLDTGSNVKAILLAYQNETLLSVLNYTNKYVYEFTENPGTYTLRLIVYDQPSNEIIYSGEQKFLLGMLVEKIFYSSSDTTFNNNLKVDLTVKVPDSGNYTVSGTILDMGDKDVVVGLNSTECYLSSGLNIISLSFEGAPLYGRDIILYLCMYNNSGILIESTWYNPVTDTDSFDQTVSVTRVGDNYGLDLNENGLYDYLSLAVELNTQAPGNYTLSGYLVPSVDNSSEFLIADNTTRIDGVTEVILNFDGAEIRKFGLNTTYNLSSLTIYDQDSTLLYLSNSDFCYTTNYYKFGDFDEERAILPDLTVTAEYNESVVEYNVCNIGDQIAEDLIVKVIDLDVNQTISSLPILALLPGECIGLRRDTSASRIKIMVDPDNKIPEIDECNNEVTPV